MSLCLFSMLYTVWFFQPLCLFLFTSSLSFCIFWFSSIFFWNCLFIFFLCTLWSFGCHGTGTGCSCAPILLPASGGPRRWKRTLANGVLLSSQSYTPRPPWLYSGPYLHVVVWHCASNWIAHSRVLANQRKAWLQWICMADQWGLVNKSYKNVNWISVGISKLIYSQS